MHILISNDDGCQSPGLKILADYLGRIADVTVVAPLQDHSAASNSLTLERPLRVVQLEKNLYSVNGTPTDCVHLAITGLFRERPPDMVVSGINLGENLGDDVIYSGTVAAALEGRFLGLPAIAVSITSGRPCYLETAAEIARRMVRHVEQVVLSREVVLNVNVPDLPFSQIKGIKSTRLGNRHLAEPVIKAKDPKGQDIYWVGAPGSEQDAGEGTDFYAIADGCVSVTPLHTDLTKYQSLDNLCTWLAQIKLSNNPG